MVEQYISADKPRRIWPWILLVILIIIIGLGVYIYLAFFSVSSNDSLQNGENIYSQNISKIDINTIPLILQALGAGQLHKNPLNSEKPIICLAIDNKKFWSEISSPILVKEQDCQGDIEIISTEQEILASIQAGDMTAYLKQSINEGKTQIKQVASQSTLFAKGYLKLYNSLK